MAHDEKSDVPRRLLAARQFIDRNYARPLHLKDVAAHVYFSPFHLLRLFKQRFGTTPHQYLTQTRIEHAKRYLIRSNFTVTEVCFKDILKLFNGDRT